MTSERLAALRVLMDALGCPAMVVGGLAVAARGEPRFTRDADITVVAPDAAVPGLLVRAGEAGFRPLPEDPVAFARERGVIPLERTSDGWRVDLILAASPFEEAAVARATIERAEGIALPIATAEDLVVLKLLAGRARDVDDARGIVARSGEAFGRDFVRAVVGEAAASMADDALLERMEDVLA